MKKVAVIYSSKYGATKKYAAWIAEALGADLLERAAVKPAQIPTYDLVVYGGGLYAGGISGIEKIKKTPPKKLVVFTVGMFDPAKTDYSDILNKNFTPALLISIKVFHLRGGIDYQSLSPVHKGMMAMVKKLSLDKKTSAELSEDDKTILETYGAKVDFTDRSSIKPIIEHIRSLSI
jgi:hypothetical protein